MFSNSVKVSPSGISPPPQLYFYCMLRAKHAFVQETSFMKQCFKYQKTITAVGGYFSQFSSPCNTSSPHRCVISKTNSSEAALHLNRPVILGQGSQMLKFTASHRNWYLVEEKRKEKQNKTPQTTHKKTDLVNIHDSLGGDLLEVSAE